MYVPSGGYASTWPGFNITGEVNMGKVESPLTFAKGVGILKNPNIWIVDMGASMHSTPHAWGITNGREAYDSEKVTMEAGKSVKPNQVGDIVGQQYDQHGNPVL